MWQYDAFFIPWLQFFPLHPASQMHPSETHKGQMKQAKHVMMTWTGRCEENFWTGEELCLHTKKTVKAATLALSIRATWELKTCKHDTNIQTSTYKVCEVQRLSKVFCCERSQQLYYMSFLNDSECHFLNVLNIKLILPTFISWLIFNRVQDWSFLFCCWGV